MRNNAYAEERLFHVEFLQQFKLSSDSPNQHLGLVKACRQTHEEASRVLYGHNRFILDNYSYDKAWMSIVLFTMRHTNAHYLRHISLIIKPTFSSTGITTIHGSDAIRQKALEIINSLPNVQSLNIRTFLSLPKITTAVVEQLCNNFAGTRCTLTLLGSFLDLTCAEYSLDKPQIYYSVARLLRHRGWEMTGDYEIVDDRTLLTHNCDRICNKKIA